MKAALPALAAALMLVSATAFANGDRHSRERNVTAPQPIAEVAGQDDRHATVVGTVQQTDGRTLTLADGSGSLRIDLEHFGGHNALTAGRLITVVGKMDDDTLEARRIILDDGSLVEPARPRY